MNWIKIIKSLLPPYFFGDPIISKLDNENSRPIVFMNKLPPPGKYKAEFNAETNDLVLKNTSLINWISVKDRLPRHHQDVLCYHNANGLLCGYYSEPLGGEFVVCGNIYKIDSGTITHWMPLPEPPKE